MFLHFLKFCLDDLSIGENGGLESLTKNVLMLVCVFSSSNMLLMKSGAPEFGVHMFRIAISQLIVPLIRITSLVLVLILVSQH